MAEIPVAIVYITPEQETLKELIVAEGMTANELIKHAQLSDVMAEEELRFGVFGKLVPGDYVLQAHDRVELYRPLIIDPKEARRQRAAKQKKA